MEILRFRDRPPSRPRPQGRSHPFDGQPLHVSRWSFHGLLFEIELITPDEWDRLHPSDRPGNVVLDPVVGCYVTCRWANR